MAEDEEGFLYPQVDTSKCVDCHLCEKVCPVINKYDPIIDYPYLNPEAERLSVEINNIIDLFIMMF